MSDGTKACVVSPSSVLLRPGWAFKMAEVSETRKWSDGPSFILFEGEESIVEGD